MQSGQGVMVTKSIGIKGRLLGKQESEACRRSTGALCGNGPQSHRGKGCHGLSSSLASGINSGWQCCAMLSYSTCHCNGEGEGGSMRGRRGC